MPPQIRDATGAWPSLWRVALRRIAEGVDRDRVLRNVKEGGESSGRYLMMSVLSAGIATLGLLQSSPAVVIGAMLVSPLMGPIILLGFAFRTLDWSSARRAVGSLALGLGSAMAVAIVLTWASPLKQPTSEILSRTHPTLFDLLVASFSGLAGGYAAIRERGEMVIGVAIATALMPPVATVGFGLGVDDMNIAGGALLLLATNLIAIALAAAAMASLYGFAPRRMTGTRPWLGHAAVILVLAALCTPLTLSLNSISLESRAATAARGQISRLFGKSARISTLTVRSNRDGLAVDALVATPKYVDHASDRLAAALAQRLRTAAHVSLDQVVLANPGRLAEAANAPSPVSSALNTVRDLREAVPVPTDAVAYDADSHTGIVVLSPAAKLGLAAAQILEQGLRARPGLGRVEVLPPVTQLPPIAVTVTKGAEPTLDANLALDAWALRRWRVSAVDINPCRLFGRARDVSLAAVKAALAPLSVTERADALACRAAPGHDPLMVLSPG